MASAEVDLGAQKSAESEVQDPVSFGEFKAFAGNDSYPLTWIKYRDQHARLAGFNGWAALFGIQWFFYRKLYIQGLVSLVLELGVPFGLAVLLRGVFSPEWNSAYERPLAYGLLAAIVLTRVGLGFWANIPLYGRALRVIRKVDGLNLSNNVHLGAISQLGGVSLGSVIGLYIVCGIIKLFTQTTLG